jgi:transposase
MAVLGGVGRASVPTGWWPTRPTAIRRSRAELRRRGIAAVITSRSDQPRRAGFDKAAYRQRNRVERSVNRLKQLRRVATRYEKLAVNYLAWVTLGVTLIWL